MVARITSVDHRDDGSARELNWLQTRFYLAAFFSMGVMVFSIVLYADVVVPGSAVSSDGVIGAHPLGPLTSILQWLALGFATPAVLLLGVPLLLQSLPRPLVRPFVAPQTPPSTVNALVSLGAFSAYALSVVNTARGSGVVYFDTAVMLLLLVTLGRYLEARARSRTREHLSSVLAMTPRRARQLAASPGGYRVGETRRSSRSAADVGAADVGMKACGRSRVPYDASDRGAMVQATDVQVGAVVRVLAGERLPLDGTVLGGRASVDRSLLSGESSPQECEPGADVAAGSLCIEGWLDVEVTRRVGDRLVDRVAALMDQARHSRPRVERLAERAAGYFLAITLGVAFLTFAYWGRRLGWNEGLLHALAVLLIACPCALGIAAPLAIHVALLRAAARGAVVRAATVFEALTGVTDFFFDKTGTLTERDLELSRVITSSGVEPEELLATADALVRYSNHPLADAVRLVVERRHRGGSGDEQREVVDDTARLEPQRDDCVTALQQVAGLGISGKCGSRRVAVGRRRLIEAQKHLGPDDLARARRDLDDVSQQVDESESVVYVLRDNRVLGLLAYGERLRPEAVAVTQRLQAAGCRVTILTGDRRARGEAIGAKLGVPVIADLLPDEKLRFVRDAVAQGRRVVMVGDGVNDAPVLAAAHVGIAMAHGADLAIESAQVTLHSPAGSRVLDAVPYLLGLAKATTHRIRRNLFWAFGYNSLGLTLAACGKIHPVVAALLMVVSSLCVVRISTAKEREPTRHRKRTYVPGVHSEGEDGMPSAQEAALAKAESMPRKSSRPAAVFAAIADVPRSSRG